VPKVALQPPGTGGRRPALGGRPAGGLPPKGDKRYELKLKEAAFQRQETGMVFQRFNLFPPLTAVENIVLAPMRVKGISMAKAVARAKQLIERVATVATLG